VLDSRNSEDAYRTINRLERLLKEKYGLAHTTLQIEHLDINHLNESYFEEVKHDE
ncbi:cation transporter, partial [Staphylococcus pseudintermedius]